MGNIQSMRIAFHTIVCIGENVFVWGGDRPSLPKVHDSPVKRHFTSSVIVYNLLSSSFVKRRTTGTPPSGAINYRCCSVGDDIYYFGGCCELLTSCYHNNLFVLNTRSYEWREITCDGYGPMRKAWCGMIPFGIDGEDYLLVIGGVGPLPTTCTTSQPAHSKYIRLSMSPSKCYTNEIRIMCITSIPGKWIIPKISGSEFIPSAGFTVNVIPGNRAIIFGGIRMEGPSPTTHNDVFIISYTNRSVSLQRLVNPDSDPSAQWPSERCSHSSVLISSIFDDGVKRHYLLVLGGYIKNHHHYALISDHEPTLWIMDIEKKNWTQVSVPEEVVKRRAFSMTSYMMSVNCVWILITGGSLADHAFVTGPENLMIVELAFTNTWSVSKIMNKTEIMDTARFTQLVTEHLLKTRKITEKWIQPLKPSNLTQQLAPDVPDSKPLIKPIQQVKQDQIQHLQWQIEQMNFQQEETVRQHERTIEQYEDTIRQNNLIFQQNHEIMQEMEGDIADLRNQLDSHPWILQREEVQLTDEKIGNGSYGSVKIAVFRGTKVAAKCLHDLIVSRHNKSIFIREMEISSKIHHPNIVQFIGATRVGNPILVYELMATSLHNRLQDDKSLTRPQILCICLDILFALCYIHGWKPHPILHRDVSSPNVLMEPLGNDRYRSKLSDFGSANLQLHVKTVIPGNPAYAAPEAINPEHHSPSMDVYSFGILLTEMVLHQAPEMVQSRRVMRARRIKCEAAKAIVLSCIADDRSQRLTSLQLLKELQRLYVQTMQF